MKAKNKYPEYQKKYAKKHSTRKTVKTKEYFRRIRVLALAALGNRCIRCGFDDIRALQIDHINGGGLKDIKSVTRCYHNVVIESVLRNEGKYQLLCANCNWIKRVENKEHR